VATLATVLENTISGVPSGHQLLVMDPEQFWTYPLPAAGALTIGRGEHADVQLSDPLASREHARLHIGEGGFELEDLESRNKTRLREVPLSPHLRVTLEPGEAFGVGATLLMIQQRSPMPRPRRLWPHGYFEARIEEECARSEGTLDPFAVVRVHVEGAVAAARLFEPMRRALRGPDMLAEYAPGEYEVLLVRTEPSLASAIARDVVAKLAEAGLDARTGVATYPRDGRVPEQLIAVACSRVRGADEGGTTGLVVGQSAAMQRLYAMADQAAQANISVLILGETGVGKEVMADRIHRKSARAGKPFVCLDCGALPANLLQSELFGHERGAFTNAISAKPGLFELAHGGTLFLDEVGELPIDMQQTLLRVLETKQVRRVGALHERAIDVRFVAATNRDLEAAIAQGKFRRDLYYRLNKLALQIPPLRERRAEIAPLGAAFLAQFAKEMGRRRPARLGAEATRLLEAHVWPGNIRELRNCMERATVLCAGGDEILPEHLPLEDMAAAAAMFGGTVAPSAWAVAAGSASAARPGDRDRPTGNDMPASPPAHRTTPPGGRDVVTGHERGTMGLPPPPGDTEKERILRALARHAGNQTRAAAELGMARSTFVLRLDHYAIDRPRKPSTATR